MPAAEKKYVVYGETGKMLRVAGAADQLAPGERRLPFVPPAPNYIPPEARCTALEKQVAALTSRLAALEAARKQ